MNRNLLILVIVIAIVAVVGLSTTAFFSLGQQEKIKIGVVVPLSGDMAMYGLSSKVALELAADELNWKLNGKQFEFVFEDGQCSAQAGAQAYNKLVYIEEVDYIIGGVCSPETLPGADILSTSRILDFAISASAPQMRATGRYMFTAFPLDDLDGKISAEYIYNKLNIKTAAILASEDDWGKGQETAFTKRFTELGGKISVLEHNTKNDIDVKTQLNKIKSSNAQILFAPQYSGMQRTIIIQTKEVGLNIPLFIPNQLDVQVVKETYPISEGIYTTRVQMPKPSTEFVNKMIAKAGTEKLDFELCSNRAYDIMYMLNEATEKTNSFNTEKIIDYLLQIEYNGVTGKHKFDKDGMEIGADFRVMRVIDGNLALQ